MGIHLANEVMPFDHHNTLRPTLRPLDETGERTIWVVVENCHYHSDKLGVDITIPKGAMTDLASVPRDLVAWSIAGGVGASAAVIHDYLYRTGSQPKDTADSIFLEILLETGVAEWRARIMYEAVRQFGASSYKGETEAKT